MQKIGILFLSVILGGLTISLLSPILGSLSIFVGALIGLWFSRKRGIALLIEDGALLGLVIAAVGTLFSACANYLLDQVGLGLRDGFSAAQLAAFKSQLKVDYSNWDNIVFSSVIGFVGGGLAALILKNKHASQVGSRSEKTETDEDSDSKDRGDIGTSHPAIAQKLHNLVLMNLFLPGLMIPVTLWFKRKWRDQSEIVERMAFRACVFQSGAFVWIAVALVFEFLTIRYLFVPMVRQMPLLFLSFVPLLFILYIPKLSSPLLGVALYYIPVIKTSRFIKHTLGAPAHENRQSAKSLRLLALSAPIWVTWLLITYIHSQPPEKTAYQATVIDYETREPISNAIVMLKVYSGLRDSVRVETDESGTFHTSLNSKITGIRISKDGYYPLRYYEWQDVLTLYPQGQMQDLPVWTMTPQEKIRVHRSRPHDKTWSARREVELIPGYPVTFSFSSDAYSYHRAQRKVQVTTDDIIWFRYHGADYNLFYGIKAFADSEYVSDFILNEGIYSFKTADGGFGKFFLDQLEYQMFSAYIDLRYHLQYLINTASNNLESTHLLEERVKGRGRNESHLGRVTPARPADTLRDIRDLLREEAEKEGFAGGFSIRLLIDEEGKLVRERILIIRTPSDSLAQTAIRELLKMEWIAAERGGKSFKAPYIFGMTFRGR